jgi:RNA polymerase sigma-70 factor, ECF subfamily
MPMNASDREREEQLRVMLAADLDGSFEQLVVAYQDRLYAFALRLTGSPRDAEEIAQDAFVRAYRALRNYAEERVLAMALKAWLYRIALNVARNRLRGKRLGVVSFDQEEGDEPLDLPDDATPGPEEVLERAEEQRQLAGLVAALPNRYRAAVILRHVEGLSYAEVADILKQPAGTVKANVHRGVQLLRAGLAYQEPAIRDEWRHNYGKAETILARDRAPISGRASRSR